MGCGSHRQVARGSRRRPWPPRAARWEVERREVGGGQGAIWAVGSADPTVQIRWEARVWILGIKVRKWGNFWGKVEGGYVLNGSIFPKTFAIVLPSFLHDLKETNPD